MLFYRKINGNRQIRKKALPIAFRIIPLLLFILAGLAMIGVAFPGQRLALTPRVLPARFLSKRLSQYQRGPERGMFLIASRDLFDPNFLETVVLLIEYREEGALGLVINRPSEVELSTVFPEMKGVKGRADRVYVGGPVGRSEMLLLIQSDRKPEGSLHVFDNVYVSSSRKVLQQLIDHGHTGEKFRVYAGHAGWSTGQLEQEVSQGYWHVLRADVEFIFHKAPSEIWPELILRSSGRWTKLRRPGRNRR